MRYVVLAASLALVLLWSSSAAAWDPDEWDSVEALPPVAAWEPEPLPIEPPPGVYLVTETYSGDVVTHDGPTTTYTTETVHEVTGSYARVLESVDTGGSSSYDGAAFNGRASLSDGRSVAGTYYENYVRTDDGFVPVSVVFFQDDAEIARAARALAPPSVPTAGPVTAPPAAASPAAAAPVDASARGAVRPEPAAMTDPDPTERTDPAPAAPLPDRSIEVLRSRRTTISFAGSGVRGWRLLAGDVVLLAPATGLADDPLIARWDRLAPPGASWVLRVAIDRTDGTSRDLAIRVTVRAPGLVE